MIKSKIQAIGLLIAVAVAGFAAGAATQSYAHERSGRKDWRRSCSYSGVLQHELGLSDEQRDSLRAVLQRYRPRMREVFDRIRPEMDSLRAQMRAEMRAMLTPAQQLAFDSLNARERAERTRQERGTNVERR